MKSQSNLVKIHEYLSQQLPPAAICADLTAGNGHDTLFLAKHFKHVYSVDIQPTALAQTKKITQHLKNITYILADHQLVDTFLVEPLDLAIYNLGYLPGGDKNLITQPASTLNSLNALLKRLKPASYLVITCYLAHPGGYQEYLAVRDWLKHQGFNYQTLTYPSENSPITYLIELKDNQVAL